MVRGKGLVVLSGCGHAGIVNTVHHAQALTGIQQVHAVIGGFHLGPTFFHTRIQPVVEALIALEPAIIAPAHCTGYQAAYAVYQVRPDAFVQNTVGTPHHAQRRLSDEPCVLREAHSWSLRPAPGAQMEPTCSHPNRLSRSLVATFRLPCQR